MKRRYIHFMKGVRPSEEFLDHLESEMTRTLFRKRRAAVQCRRAIRYAAVAAVLVIVAAGALMLRPEHPDLTTSPVLAAGKGSQRAPSPTPGIDPASTVSTAPTSTPMPAVTAEPTVQPTASPEDCIIILPTPAVTAEPTALPESHERVQPTFTPTPIPTITPASAVCDSESVSDIVIAEPTPEGGWLEPEVLNETLPGDLTAFYLARQFYGTNGNYPMEIHAGPDLNSETTAVLEPGTPHWISDDSSHADVFEKNGEDIGFADYVLWWDAENHALNAGWHITVDEDSLGNEISPEISVDLPGKVRADGTALRYAPDENAPVVASLSAGDTVYLYARQENWIFVTGLPYSASDLHGWIHVSDLYYLNWGNISTPLYLSVDRAEILQSPSGKAIATVTREEADAGKLFYLGSVQRDDAVYHWVMFGEFMSEDGTIPGYIPAEYCTLPEEDWQFGETQLPLAATEEDYWVSDFIFDRAAALYGGIGKRPMEVYSDASFRTDKPFALLDAGVPYWIDTTRENQDLFDGGENIGYAVPILWWDEAMQQLCEGWQFIIGWDNETVNLPDDLIKAPGKVGEGGASLHYGRDENSPVVTTLDPGQIIYLYCRVDNWIFATCGMDGDCGWIHVSDVSRMLERAPINRIELLADVVNLRAKPDGEIIGQISRENDHLLRYAQATFPGKSGDWHYVTLASDASSSEELRSGYISADYSVLNTFTLDEYLSMDDVVSCTLRYAPTEFYSEIPFSEQTITGDRLERWLVRLGAAYSEQVFSEVCAQGVATLTLKYADGSEAVLNLAGDSCTMVGYGDVVYDLKTAEERTERFLNDGGVSLSEILPQYFDEIDLYWD